MVRSVQPCTADLCVTLLPVVIKLSVEVGTVFGGDCSV